MFLLVKDAVWEGFILYRGNDVKEIYFFFTSKRYSRLLRRHQREDRLPRPFRVFRKYTPSAPGDYTQTWCQIPVLLLVCRFHYSHIQRQLPAEGDQH
jgi:hypothetical protein